MMLHTKYQGSRSYGLRPEDFSMFPYISQCKTGFRQEDFFHFSPYISLCKTCDLWAGTIFGPMGII